MTAAEQLALVDDAGLCNYGLPKLGEPRHCTRVAAHAAVWFIPQFRLDGTPSPRAGTGRIECCRDHADYYASAWFCPHSENQAWIDILT